MSGQCTAAGEGTYKRSISSETADSNGGQARKPADSQGSLLMKLENAVPAIELGNLDRKSEVFS